MPKKQKKKKKGKLVCPLLQDQTKAEMLPISLSSALVVGFI